MLCHELTVVTRMLQTYYALVNFTYTEIKSAGSVSGKVTVEKQLKSDMSELKIVYAARTED